MIAFPIPAYIIYFHLALREFMCIETEESYEKTHPSTVFAAFKHPKLNVSTLLLSLAFPHIVGQSDYLMCF